MNQNPDFFNAYILMHRPLINHTNRILEKHELSNSYWRVLRILETAESQNFGDITTALMIEKPALTKIVKKLSIMEIVEIQRGQDKREKIVMLTAFGKEKVRAIRSELNPFLENALAGLSQEQLNNTIAVLETIQKNIKRY